MYNLSSIGILACVGRRAMNPSTPEPANHWAGPAMVVFALTIVGLLVFRAVQVARSPRDVPSQVNSVAVLPFVDVSEKHDQQSFCDALTAEVIRSLKQLPGLRVATNSSNGVEAVLQGNVRTEDGRAHVTAQLIRVSDRKQLWSETYDPATADAGSIQQSIAEKFRGKAPAQH
jgi:TolB-like protein